MTQPRKLITDYLTLLRHAPSVPDIAVPLISDSLPARDIARPCALLFSPHPDDECLTGALPLRLRHENWQIINIAITLGSNSERRGKRLVELSKACAVLGFGCALPQADGFENVTVETREKDSAAWQKKVDRLAAIVAHYKPQAIFLPHNRDEHVTHVGTHFLGMDALAKQPVDFSCAVFQTEYWSPIAAPNLMVGVDEEDAAILLSALAYHAGEVARNPFDVRFPAYLIDNVRRGSELVGGKGNAAAQIDFAVLYQQGLWKNGRFMLSALKRTQAAGQTVWVE